MTACITVLIQNYMPIGMWEDEYVHTTQITWERDPALVASMFALQDTPLFYKIGGLTISTGNESTIIQEVPTNRRELQTFGHECLHAFGYTHD